MITAAELVQKAMDATNSATPTQLARSLRMTAYSAPRNIQRWLDGVSAPEYESTLLLLEAAGMLAASGPGATAGQARAEDDPELVRELEELADLLERLQQLGSSIGRRASGA